MQKLGIIFGYAGAIPFILLMLMSIVGGDEYTSSIAVLHVAYTVIILSFLGGVHWGQSLKSGNLKQISFSMLPSVIGFILMGFVIWIDPYVPLLFAAILFWVIYYADKKFMPFDVVPERYFIFRRNLTLLVSLSLCVSFLAHLV